MPPPELSAAYEEGRNLFGPLLEPPSEYHREASARIRKRLEAAGIDPRDEVAFREAASRIAGADLFLALACDRGVERAWSILGERYRAPLRAVALRRGLRAAVAEEILEELWGDLALPPPRGTAGTRVGTFDGSGTLFHWLVVVLERRILDRRRGRRVLSLEVGEDVARGARHASAAPPADPLEAVLAGENAALVEAAFERTWKTLTRREQEVLRLRFAEDVAQKNIADRLGIGAPRVSRLVNAAVAKLRQGIREAAPASGGGGGGTIWEALRDVFSRRLATLRPDCDRSGGEPH